MLRKHSKVQHYDLDLEHIGFEICYMQAIEMSPTYWVLFTHVLLDMVLQVGETSNKVIGEPVSQLKMLHERKDIIIIFLIIYGYMLCIYGVNVCTLFTWAMILDTLDDVLWLYLWYLMWGYSIDYFTHFCMLHVFECWSCYKFHVNW